MANGINKVILIGNLGQDPEVKMMQNGESVANASVATGESWTDKATGQRKERVEWHRVVFYRRLAEVVGQYLRKGAKVYIEGRLRTRQWEKDGVKHYTTEVIADTMQMLDAKAQPAQDGHQQAKQDGYAPDQQGFDEDIPF